MKKLITILSCLMFLSCTAYCGGEETPHLTIEGKFLNKSFVKYEVLVVNSDNSLESVYKNSGTKYFTVDLEVNNIYLVKFTSINGVIKYLYVDAAEEGEFIVDVDFNSKQSAKLTFKKGRYDIYRLGDDDPEYSLCKK